MVIFHKKDILIVYYELMLKNIIIMDGSIKNKS